LSNANGFDFVLDCSITMAWLFSDESTSHTEYILQLLDSAQAVVPTIWPLEVANVLALAVKNKRVTALEASSFVDALSSLPIYVDESTTVRAMHSIYTLATRESLTIYDASYLELALRENIPIATLDKDLLKASKALKIKIL
jgi:predicted nucleic acid-binding protein